MLINYQNLFICFLYYSYIFLIGFMNSPNSFFGNLNIAYNIVYVVVFSFLFYKNEFFMSIFSKKNKYIFIMLFSFLLSTIFTPLDLYQSWIGFLKICSVTTLGLLTCFLISKGVVDIIKISILIAVSGLIQVFILLWMWFTLPSPQDYDWVSGLYFFNNIRNFTDYISICFFCALFLVTFSQKNIIKVVFLVTSFFLLTCIIWSGSRTAYIGVFGGLVFFIYYSKNLRIFALSSFLVIFSIVSSLFFQTNNSSLGFFRTYYKIQYNPDAISSGRLTIYKELLEYIGYYPVLGYGGEAVRQLNIYGRAQAHNSVLQILIEFGFLGLICFIVLLIKMISKINYHNMNKIEILIISVLLNILILSFFNGGFYYTIILALMCVFVGAFYAEDYNLRKLGVLNGEK